MNLVDPSGLSFLKKISQGAYDILNWGSGGALDDIACNGLNWGNGLKFGLNIGVNLLPGGAEVRGGKGVAEGGERLAGEYLAKKAPRQVTPGTRVVEGVYKNDRGRVEPWKAYYDEYGRRVGRTDYNAGDKSQGIPDIHHHAWEYGPGYGHGREVVSHAPGEYVP